MSAADLIRILERFAPADSKEHRDRDAIVAFLRRGGGDPFDRRRFDPGHLTGSAFIVDDRGERMLLVHHARLDRWIQPGGHADPGEDDPLEVALREAREETGIRELAPHPRATLPFDIDIHRVPAHASAEPEKNEPAHEHLDVRYLLVARHDARPRASAESKAVAWLPLSECGDESDPGLVRAVQKARALVSRR